MKIRAIEAKNFRTLENFQLSFTADYCTLSGQNNAGKTAVVRAIQHFLMGDDNSYIYRREEQSVNFSRDHTQWSQTDIIKLSLLVDVFREEDSDVFFVVNKFSPEELQGSSVSLLLEQHFKSDGSTAVRCKIGSHDVDPRTASEIIKKLKSASSLIIHNSTAPQRHLYYAEEGLVEVLEAQFSADDRKRITDAENTLLNRVKSAAKQHEALGDLLGRLNDQYQVELTSIAGGRSSRFPLSIKLTDKSVDVPLTD